MSKTNGPVPERIPAPAPSDEYSRVDYRRFVAWPARIERERPLLEHFLRGLPDRSVLDLGCGTGEHTRFLHDLGCTVRGIDQSATMIEKAREQNPENTGIFTQGDICQLDSFLDRRYGGAISLGNTLPHLIDPNVLNSFLDGLAKRLLAGGLVLLQLLNYERILAHDVRYLPLNFRDHGDHETVFLRLMEPLANGRVLFCPTTLRFDPDADSPVEVVRSKRVELMGWTREDLFPALGKSGFEVVAEWGDVEFTPFSPDAASDLVILARRTVGPGNSG